MKQELFHFGRWLKREIATREVTVTAFGASVGISVASLYAWFAAAAPGIRGDYIARLARGLGLTYEQVESKLNEARAAHHETAAA